MLEKLQPLFVGKTIEKIELSSYKATNDTLILNFTDKTHIKIVSDPDNCFDGLAFFLMKTIEVEQDERISP